MGDQAHCHLYTHESEQQRERDAEVAPIGVVRYRVMMVAVIVIVVRPLARCMWAMPVIVGAVVGVGRVWHGIARTAESGRQRYDGRPALCHHVLPARAVMPWIVTRYLIAAAIVVAVSELAKRSDRLGGLLGSLPLVTSLTLT